MKKKYRVVIGSNNCPTNDPCAICGQRTDPRGFFDFFLEGTLNLVCDQCAEKHSPGLTLLYERGIEVAQTTALNLCVVTRPSHLPRPPATQAGRLNLQAGCAQNTGAALKLEG